VYCILCTVKWKPKAGFLPGHARRARKHGGGLLWLSSWLTPSFRHRAWEIHVYVEKIGTNAPRLGSKSPSWPPKWSPNPQKWTPARYTNHKITPTGPRWGQECDLDAKRGVSGTDRSSILESKMVPKSVKKCVETYWFFEHGLGINFGHILSQNGTKIEPMRPESGSQNWIESKKRVFSFN